MIPDYDEDGLRLEPLRIFIFSDSVAAVDGEILMQANGLRSIASRLLGMGHEPARELHVRHAGQDGLTRVLLRDAANQQENEF